MGNLGMRSLEAFSNNNYDIYIYDHLSEKLDTLLSKNECIKKYSSDLEYDFFHCATNPQGRDLIMNSIINKINTLSLVEKPLYSNITSALNFINCPLFNINNVYVNCNRRYIPIHNFLNINLANIIFNLKIKSSGINCLGNITHFIDLMIYYGAVLPYKVITNPYKTEIVKTKRNNIYDINRIEIEFSSGHILELENDISNLLPDYEYTFIENNSVVFKFKETSKEIITSQFSLDINLLPVNFFMMYHSQLVVKIFEEYKVNSKINLPNIYDTALNSLEWLSFAHKCMNIPRKLDLPIS